MAGILLFVALSLLAQTPGRIDSSFDLESVMASYFHAPAPTVEGKVYIGGSFGSGRDIAHNRIDRFQAHGSQVKSINANLH